MFSVRRVSLYLIAATVAYFAVLPLSAQAQTGEAEKAQASPSGDAERGKILFRQRCSSCHYAEGDKNRIGPPLGGVFGHKAGQAPNYNYSAAMRKAGQSGLEWTDANLRQFLQAPQKFMPGTRMPPVPRLAAQDLPDLIRYLAEQAVKQH